MTTEETAAAVIAACDPRSDRDLRSKFEKQFENGMAPAEILRPFSQVRLRKRRMQKKFRKDTRRYVSERIWIMLFGIYMAYPLRRRLNYASVGRQLVSIQELPTGATCVYGVKNA